MKSVEVTTSLVSRLQDLTDCGKFREAETLLNRDPKDMSPLIQILGAEIDIYFERLDRAANRLHQALALVGRDSLARFVSVRGQLHYCKFEYEQADEDLQLAYRLYKFAGDTLHVATAQYNLGRLRRRQSRYKEAQSLLGSARQLIKLESQDLAERFEFLRGLIDFNDAVCIHQQGHLDDAGRLYASSIELLRRSEGGKYYGCALNSYAMHLRRLGRLDEAVACLENAIRIAECFGAPELLAAPLNNLSLVMLRMKRYEEAERLVREAIELYQRAGSISGVSEALDSLAQVYLEKGELERAERVAVQAMEQADLSRNPFDQAEADIRLGIISYRKHCVTDRTRGGFDDGCQSARRFLESAIRMNEEIGSKELSATATLYLAEVYLGISVVKGREILERARELVHSYGDIYLIQEFERIAQRYQGERMTLSNDNCLSISGNFLPRVSEAKAEVERFLIKNALHQAGNNQSEAGRLLGVSKVYIHQKRKQFGL